MKYLEVKEFIESLPENPLVEYSVAAMVDVENLSAEPSIYSLDVEADFSPDENGPYSRCFLEISKEDDKCDYRTYTRFSFEPSDWEREELANKVFGMMKEFVCKQMMRDSND